MKKNILITLLVLLSVSSVFSQKPLEKLDIWAAQQTKNFDADDVVKYLNGGQDRTAGDITFGSEYVFNQGDIGDVVSATSLDETHFVVAFQDWTDMGNGVSMVGTINGAQIIYGSKFEYYPDLAWGSDVTALDVNHFVVVYTANTESKAKIGTVSGNTISFGSSFTFNLSSSGFISAATLNTTTFVVSYRDTDNSFYGTSVIGTVSGNTISFGSEYVYNASITYNCSTASLTETSFVVTYADRFGSGNDFGTAVIGIITGNTISFGNEYVFRANGTSYTSVTALDNTHFVVAYAGGLGTYGGWSNVGNVSGDVISFGAAYTFNNDGTAYCSAVALDETHFIIAFQDQGDNSIGTSIYGTVSGNVISFGSKFWFNLGTTQTLSAAPLTTNKFVIAYKDESNSNSGTAIVGEIESSASTEMILEFNLDLSTGTTITLPLYGTVDVTVDWGDGNSEVFTTTGDKNHTYATAGTKTVGISGSLTQFGSGNAYSNAEKLVKVTNFGNLGLTSLTGAFYGTTNLDEVPASLPSTIANMSYTFQGTGKTSITGLDSWDVSNVTYMYSMFKNAESFNQDISSWNIGNVTNTAFMFFSCYDFNQNISGWDLSSVLDMSGMFRNAYSFNQPIGSWDMSSVNDMEQVFLNAESFNQNISNWNVSNVSDMSFMFSEADNFNQNIDVWDVSGVTNMEKMFRYTNFFNQSLNTWDVSNVTNMNGMFYNAAAYDQTNSNWNISNVTNISDMFSGVTLSTPNYSNILIAWAALDLYDGLTFNGGNSKYSSGAAATARASIIADDLWTITDGGLESNPDMTLEFNLDLSSGTTITLPLYGTVNVSVDWGDGNSEPFTTAGDKDHSYASGGIKTVTISGTLTHFGEIWGGYNNADKLVKVSSFGDLGLTSLQGAFYGTTNLEEVPAYLPTTVTNLSYAFQGTGKASITGLNSWIVSNITNMRYLFRDANIFNTDLSNWDVSSVTDMYGLFSGASNFDQDISSWDVSSATNMDNMFFNSTNFNQDISSWNVSNVITMSQIFGSASAFNCAIGGWNISNVTNMSGAFYGTLTFNQPLNNWDVSSVTTMDMMFYGSAFNQDISSWDVSSVTNMEFMFGNMTAFDQDISSWNVSNVTIMDFMFTGVTLSTSNYNNLLIAWATLDLYNGVNFSGGNSKYSAGAAAAARAAIIADDSWTITDGGQEASIVWDGSLDSEWAVSGNWVGGASPTITDNVVIPVSSYNPVIIPGSSGSCNNLVIDNGASLTLNSDDVSGTASLIANGYINNNGTVTAERYVTAAQWHGISSPLSGTTANTFYLNGNPDVWLKEWNETSEAYEYITDINTPLADMEGLFIWIGGDVDQTFSIVGNLRSGEIGTDDNLVRSDPGALSGWNYVGNPFTSAIDWNASTGWTKTNVDNTIYIYNSPNWATWNGTTGTNGGSQYIAMGQGFFVNVSPGNSSGTLKMDNGVKVHNNVAFLKPEESLEDNLIRLELSGYGFADETVIQLTKAATQGFDNEFDARKLFSFNTDAPQIYSTANDFMALNSLPLSTTEVPIDVRGSNDMEMTISLSEVYGFGNVFLSDEVTGSLINLSLSEYSFVYNEEITDRFIIYFDVVNIDEAKVDLINIYSYKKSIKVNIPFDKKSKIYIYNITGQLVSETAAHKGINNINMASKGYYVVKVVSSIDVVSRKVFIE